MANSALRDRVRQIYHPSKLRFLLISQVILKSREQWGYRIEALRQGLQLLLPVLEPLSAAIRDIAWKAQVRLCARYRRLAAIGKPKVVVTTAIAREMVGFIWAIARIAQPEII